MALITPELTVILAFDSRETLLQWQAKLRSHLPEGQQFLVQLTQLPQKSRLTTGPARLHLQDKSFCVVHGLPPRLAGIWPLQQLRKYGLVDGKFCFEGGSLCGKGEGLHVLATNQADEIARAFDLASAGKLAIERKAILKKAQLSDAMCRISATPNCVRKRLCNDSNESSRPLLLSTANSSSGSDSSTCDACSDILRFSSSCARLDTDCGLSSSDEAYSSKSTCCTSLRWSSISGSSGGGCRTAATGYSSAASLAGDVTGIGRELSSLNGKLNENHRCMFSFSSCGRCGRHFCEQNDEDRCSTNGDGSTSRTVSVNTISTLLSELRANSSSSHGSSGCVHRNGGQTNHPTHHHSQPHFNGNGHANGNHTDHQVNASSADRTSLCSQSSHSSASSSTASSNSSSTSAGYQSEYSVPRGSSHSLAETLSSLLYDRPKSVLRHTQSLDQGRCCDCDRQSQVKTPTNQDCGRCICTPSSSPKKTTNHHHVHGNVTTNLGSSLAAENGHTSALPPPPVMPAKVSLPSSCSSSSVASNPYLNYQVPRTALANMYIKEMQAQRAAAGTLPGPMTNSLTGEVYDIPKNFRVIITAMMVCALTNHLSLFSGHHL